MGSLILYGFLMGVNLIIGTLCMFDYMKYKQGIMPTGKSELTRKQIRRDFTN